MRDLLTTFLSAGMIQFINIVTGILAARLLLPEGRGELTILLLWPVLIADIGLTSLNTSVSFHMARNQQAAREIWAGLTVFVTFAFPVLIGIFFLFVPMIYSGQRPEVIELTYLCAALIPAYMYALCMMALFQGAQKFGPYNVLRSLVHFGYLGLVLLMIAFRPPSLETFVYGYIAAHVLLLGVTLWLCQKEGWISFSKPTAMVRTLFAYGLRMHVSVVLAIANRRLDQMIISIALAATDLGYFVVAMTVEGPLFLAATTMELLLFPKIAAQKNEQGRQEVLGRYFRASLILVVPATVVFLVLAPWLIGLVFGRAYLPATDTARILALSGIGFTLKVMLTTYMRASNRMRVVTIGEGIGVVVTVISLAALLPTLGLIGAAIAQVLAFTIPALVMAYLIRRDTGLSLPGLFRFEKRDWHVFGELTARFRKSEQS